jgi:hypothetical protein
MTSRIPSLFGEPLIRALRSGRAVMVLGAIGAGLAVSVVVLDKTGVGHVFPGPISATTNMAATTLDVTVATPAQAKPSEKSPIVLVGDPTPLLPSTMAPPAAAPAPAPPAAASPTQAAIKPAHAAPARPLIPPANLPSPVVATPLPRPALSIETDLLPLSQQPATPAKPSS